MPLETVETSWEAARIAIENRVRAKWVTADNQLLTPVKFWDEPKLESATGPIERPPERFPWLRVNVLPVEAFATGIGQGTTNQVRAIVQLTLFYPKLLRSDTQARPLTLGQLTGKMRGVLDNYFGEGLVFDAAGLPVNNDETNYRMRIVDCPFRYEECAN